MAPDGASSADHQLAGIDKDGRDDVTSPMKGPLAWFSSGGGYRKIEERLSRE